MAAVQPLPKLDDSFFNESDFIDKLNNSDSDISVYKEFLNTGVEALKQSFYEGRSSRDLVSLHARLVDRLLCHAWQRNISFEQVCLVAVGGYGRGELCPCSDIDLMILHKKRLKDDHIKQIESFLTLLWDIGLEVGHSVRTVKDCVGESKLDVTVMTNLLEARLLSGDESLYENMRKATGPKKIWKTQKFFAAKVEEQAKRHGKYNDSEYKLEPNVKEGPGGLRDIQIIGWVAKRHFGVARLHKLIEQDFLTEEEYQTLTSGREFLWRVRYALHLITGNREDRLMFDYQSTVAEMFGYHGENNKGIEQFMKFYYTQVFEVAQLNEMLLQHFEEDIIYARRREKIVDLNKRFQLRNDFIEVKHDKVFKRHPMALLEIFLLIQQNKRIKGVRASTIRLIRNHLYLIDDDFRNDIRNKSLFMEIMQQQRWVGHELRRMHRYGVLGRYLPLFGNIQGLMQFDLFHIYTVSEHTLFVVRNLRLANLKETQENFPLSYELMQKIPKPQLLYIAGLFHDIAKGRDGDHSELGAVDAYNFCISHGLSEFDSKLVSWLVKSHLLMSRTSQREDIDDPEIINRFAKKIGDRERLNYLYLLTVADICGTNPELWNSWKDSLLIKLHNSTQRVLRRGIEQSIDNQHRLSEIKTSAKALLRESTINSIDIDTIWDTFGDDFFMRHSPDEIAWRIEKIAAHKNPEEPLVVARAHTERGGSEIFIYMPDQDNIFATSARTMKQLGLTILDARIITSNNNYSLNSYIVLETNGNFIGNKTSKKEIADALKKSLSNLDVISAKVSRISHRNLKPFNRPTVVNFSEDKKRGWNIMEITTTDFPGLLAAIGIALQFCGVRLHGAKIATLGEQAEDIFYLTDKNNQIIQGQEKFDCLLNSVIENINKYSD